MKVRAAGWEAPVALVHSASNAGGEGGLGAEWGGFEVEEICIPIINLCEWIITPFSEFTNPGNPGMMGQGIGAGNAGSGGQGVCGHHLRKHQLHSICIQPWRRRMMEKKVLTVLMVFKVSAP